MTTPRDNLQDFLDGNDPVNELYARRAQSEPPAELDATILAAARKHAKTPERPRWLVPLSLAATVVLGTGLTVRQLSTPMRSVSESVVQDIMIDGAAPNEVTDRQRPPESAGPVPRPSMDDIPAIEFESDFAPKPVTVDLEQAQREVRSSVPLSPPALTPPPPRRVRQEAEPAPEPMAAPRPMAKTSADRDAAQAARQVAARLANRRTSGQSMADVAERASSAEDKSFRSFEVAPPLADAVTVTGRRRDAEGLMQTPDVIIEDVVDRLRDADFDEARTRLAEAGDKTPGLAISTLQRIRQLHAAGEALTAQRLLDTFVEVFPTQALPTDLPLQPTER